jgi:hypothetical protein
MHDFNFHAAGGETVFSLVPKLRERECPRNFVASVKKGKRSFADKYVPKYNLGTREFFLKCSKITPTKGACNRWLLKY